MLLYPLISTLVTGRTLRQHQSIDAIIPTPGRRRTVAGLRFTGAGRCFHVINVGPDLAVVPRRHDIPSGELRMRVLPPEVVRQLEGEFSTTQVFPTMVRGREEAVRMFRGVVDYLRFVVDGFVPPLSG